MRELRDLHSVGSMMFTMDNGIGMHTPWETHDEYQNRVSFVCDAASSIWRHHVEPLIERIERLERERLEVKTDNKAADTL